MGEKLVTIKVSKSVHSRLKREKEDLNKKLGMKFSFNATIKEIFKIIDSK